MKLISKQEFARLFINASVGTSPLSGWKKAAATLTAAGFAAAIAHASTLDEQLANGAYHLVVADMDGDQKADLLFQGARKDEHRSALTGAATATSQRWRDGFMGFNWNRNDVTLVVGDFNGDASADILLQSKTPALTSQIVQAYANGALGVPNQTIGDNYLGVRWDSQHHTILVADFDGDNRDDLFLQGTTNRERHALTLSDKDGQFNALAFDFDDAHMGINWSMQNTVLVTGDFDGDGKAEILAQPRGSGEVKRISSNARPLDTIAETLPENYLNLNWHADAHRLVVGDFNGDGKDDVVLLAEHQGLDSALILASKKGFVRIDRELPELPNLEKISQILVGDFDADGIDDLVLVYSDNQIAPTVLFANDLRRASLEKALNKLGLLKKGQHLNSAEGRTPSGLGDVGAGIHTPTPPLPYSADGSPLQQMLQAAKDEKADKAHTQSTTDDTAESWNEYGGSGGSFRVSEGGAATYNFPIVAAPGSGGMAPHISLSYNSQGGNGSVGMGWSISGLSGISRCRATKETDGYDGTINFDDNDKLCLDGERLVPATGDISTIATCPAAQTQLRAMVTEIYHGTVVLACGQRLTNTGSNNTEKITSLVAVKKDGTTNFYGNFTSGFDHATIELNDAFKNEVTSKTTYWAIARNKDSAGNFIDYIYTKDSLAGEHYLQKISYTGHQTSTRPDNGGGAITQATYAELIFNYETRNDARTAFSHGSKSTINKRLSSIVSNSESVQQRRYQLYYAPTSSAPVSQLEYIKECRDVGAVATCLPPIKFTWQRASADFADQPYSEQKSTMTSRFYSGKPADLNGDGILDLAWVYSYDHETNYYWRSFITKEISGTYQMNVAEGQHWTDVADKAVTNPWFNADYNGDGHQDTIFTQDGYWRVMLASATGALNTWVDTGVPVHTYRDVQLVDLNNDGIRDMVQVTSEGREVYVSFGKKEANGSLTFSPEILAGTISYPDTPDELTTRFGPVHYKRLYDTSSQAYWDDGQVKITDIDGDGIVDIAVTSAHACYVGTKLCDLPAGGGLSSIQRFFITKKRADGEAGTPYSFEESERTKADYIRRASSYLVDLNGDGLVDVVSQSYPQSPEIRIGSGNGFIKTVSQSFTWNLNNINFFDLNSDGLLDVVWPTGTRYSFQLQNADGTFGPVTTSKGIHDDDSDHKYYEGDFTGDGMPDILMVDFKGDNMPLRIQSFGENHVARNVITGFESTASGSKTSVEYKTLTGGPYTRLGNGPSLSYGNGSYIYDITGPMYVVSSAKSSSPGYLPNSDSYAPSFMAELRYNYTGLRMQAGGRGNLGFQKVKTTEMQSGITTETTYSQQFPYIGQPMRTEKRLVNNVLLSLSVNTLANKPAALGGMQVYASRSDEQSWDINTARSLLNHTLTKITIDDYGNTTSMWIGQYPDTSTTTFEQAKSTSATFGTDTSTQFLGRLQDSSVATARPGLTSVYRKSSFMYDANTQQLQQEILAPTGKSSEKLITTYKLDSFGNRTKTTVCSSLVSDCGNSDIQQLSNPLYINRSNSVAYDDKGRFVNKHYNHYGQLIEEVLVRDATSLYQPTSVKSTTGVIKTIDYTKMGRLKKESDSTGAWRTVDLYFNACSNNICQDGQYFEIRNNSGSDIGSLTYFDSLGRAIQQKTASFVGDGSAGAAGSLTKTNSYDTLGRVRSNTVDNTLTTSYKYDVLNRPISVTNPDGTITTSVRDGLKTTTTITPLVGSPQSHIEQRNVLGELQTVTDANNKDVNYTYNQFGALDTMTRVGLTDLQSDMSYDTLGRKIAMWDADKSPGDPTTAGWKYEYNALGEVTKQTDPRGYITLNYYDGMGRIYRRLEKDSTGKVLADNQWSFNNISSQSAYSTQLTQESDLQSGYSRQFDFDDFGRPNKTTYIFDGNQKSESLVYDTLGRAWKSTDITGQTLETLYDRNGFAYMWRDANAPQTVFRTINEMDVLGHITRETAGNGVETRQTFDQLTGHLKSISSTHDGIQIQYLNYTWDSYGNLKQRVDTGAGKNLVEDFDYDALNRLYHSKVTSPAGVQDLNMVFDDEGNISNKSDVSTENYRYGELCSANGVTAGPHAVTYAAGKSYCYDKNGNQIAGNDRTMVYGNAFDLPTIIKADDGSQTASYSYTPSHGRYKRIDVKGTTTSTSYFIGNVELILKADGSQEYRRDIGNATINNGKIYYLHRDHLGSTDVITDCFGQIDQRFSFDPYGKSRPVSDWRQSRTSWQLPPTGLRVISPLSIARTLHGYTGHEQLDELGLVHMNGRVYDPFLGRLLQADPAIQAPSNSQSLNRYSYVLNNPLSMTDPSGFYSNYVHPMRWLFSHWSYENGQKFNGIASSGCGQFYALCYAAGTYDNGLAHGQSNQQAFEAAVTAGAIAEMSMMAFQAIGNAFGPPPGEVGTGAMGSGYGWGTYLAKVGAHAIAGGTMAYLQGGKFGDGAISAGVTEAFQGAINSIDGDGVGARVERTVAAAMVGGTVSALTGGKFADGAITAAFAWQFNNEGKGHRHCTATCWKTGTPTPSAENGSVKDAAIGVVGLAVIVISAGAATELLIVPEAAVITGETTVGMTEAESAAIQRRFAQKISEAEDIGDIWMRNQARLDAISDSMLEQGYTPKQIIDTLKSLYGFKSL